MVGTGNSFHPDRAIRLTRAELDAMIDSRVQAALAEAEARRVSVAQRNNGPTPKITSVFPNSALKRWSEEARQYANDALGRAIRSIIVGAASVEPRDNKRKQPENMGMTFNPYYMSNGAMTQPGSPNKKKSGCVVEKPMCVRYEWYHTGYCYVKCTKCGIMGHMGKNCRVSRTTSNTTTKLVTGPSSSKACFGCGEVGHVKRNCPKIEKGKGKLPKPSSCAYCGRGDDDHKDMTGTHTRD